MSARNPYLFYQDPTNEDDAIRALSSIGSPDPGPTPEQKLTAAQALANAYKPTPTDSAPDQMADADQSDAMRNQAANALARLGGMKLLEDKPAEVAPAFDPTSDPGIQRLAAGALSQRGNDDALANAAPPPKPDPYADPNTKTKAFGALQQLGYDLTPPAPQRPAPLPINDFRRPYDPEQGDTTSNKPSRAPDMEITLDELEKPAVAVPRKPDMEFSVDESDAALGTKPKPAAVVELGKPVVTSVEVVKDRPTATDQNPAQQDRLGANTQDKDPVKRPGDKVDSETGQPSSKTQPGMPSAHGRDNGGNIGPSYEGATDDSLSARVAQAKANDPVGNLLGGGSNDGPPNVNGWAIAADLALNHGRGIGGIIAQAEQQKAQWQARKDKQGDKALEDRYKEAQIAHLQKTGNAAGDWAADKSALDWENARLRAQENERRGVGTDLAVDKWGNKKDADSAENTTKTAVTERNAAAGVRGREGEKHALNDQIASDVANIATARVGAGTDARQDVEAANAPRTADIAARRAADVVAAQNTAGRETPSETAVQGREAVARADRQEGLQHAPPGGFRAADPEAWGSATANPQTADKSKSFVRDATAGLAAMDRMIELRRKHGYEITKSEDGGEMDTLQNIAVGKLSNASNTASVNGGEWDRYAKRLPGLGMRGMDAVDTVTGEDSALNELVGARKALQGQLDSNLKSLGLSKVDTSVNEGFVPQGVTKGGDGHSSLAPAETGELGPPVGVKIANPAQVLKPEPKLPSGPPAGFDAQGNATGADTVSSVKNKKTGQVRKIRGNLQEFLSSMPDWEAM